MLTDIKSWIAHPIPILHAGVCTCVYVYLSYRYASEPLKAFLVVTPALI